MSHAYRFGVLASGATDGPAWRERARKAEALGYSTLLMPDHFADQWAPVVGITIAAEATEHLTVGSLVCDIDYRNPIVLAKEIATLDRASGGRVEFGLGAGWMQSDYEACGITYDRPGVRIDRMEEGLAVMKALWASDTPVTYEGDHYWIRGAVGTPRPHSSPHPTVCMGGGGRRMLSIAGREADVVGILPKFVAGTSPREFLAEASATAYDEKVDWVREAAEDRDVELQNLCLFARFGDSIQTAAESLAQEIGLPAEPVREMPMCLLGSVGEVCDTIEARRARYGFTYFVVPDEVMEDFAPVVAQLAGR